MCVLEVRMSSGRELSSVSNDRRSLPGGFE
jgi:hypothetical protein